MQEIAKGCPVEAMMAADLALNFCVVAACIIITLLPCRSVPKTTQ